MYHPANHRGPRIRLNQQPPSGATYFDPSMLLCSPCESGAVNYCQTAEQAPDSGEGKFEWLFESARGGGGAAAAAKVSECCMTELDPQSGMYKTTCNVEDGCGWVAGPFLGDEPSCRFTTDDAAYATFESCRSANPSSLTPGGGLDWFPPCEADQVKNCYYPNVDTCLPAVFGKQKAAAMKAAASSPDACPMYVCDGSSSLDIGGRRSFPSSACHCVGI